MVYGIVKQTGGYIWVYSEVGRGTTFKIYLPTAEGTAEAAAAKSTSAGRGTETVLLVEDEANVRALARSILESRGYKVLEAPSSMEALLIPAKVA
jgi:chemotaxis protein histidine kinase CheA